MPNRTGLVSATFAHPISVSAEYRLPDDRGDTALIDAGRTEHSGIVTGTGRSVRVRAAARLLSSVSSFGYPRWERYGCGGWKWQTRRLDWTGSPNRPGTRHTPTSRSATRSGSWPSF